MSRLSTLALAAGLLAGAATTASAAVDEPMPPPATPAAPSRSGTPSTSPAPPRTDPRDEEILQLKKLVGDLLRRVEDLERDRRPTPISLPPAQPPATPPGQPPVVPPTVPPGEPPPELPLPDQPLQVPEAGPLPTAGARGGATLLPNISVIGTLTFNAGDQKNVPNRGRFNFTELEVALQDAVSPSLRYDIFLSGAKEEEWKVGMEEGYLTASRLRPGLTGRIGEIRTPFGRFNPLHPHQWIFITPPAASLVFLGPDGLISDGSVLEQLLPMGDTWFGRIEGGIWQTVSPIENGFGFRGGRGYAYSGRVFFGRSLDEQTDFEVGASRYQGRGVVPQFGREMLSLNGVDFNWRQYPGPGQRIWFNAEAIVLESYVRGKIRPRVGGWFTGSYKWSPFWEFGGRLDATQLPFPAPGHIVEGSVFSTYYINEQTSLRAQYTHGVNPEFGHNDQLYFQIIFGSGPHSHPLQ